MIITTKVSSGHGMRITFSLSRNAENPSPRGRTEEEHERASHFWRFITRRVVFFAHDIAPARLRHAYRVHAKSRPALKHGAWTLSTLPRRLFIGLTSMRAQLMRAMPGCCCWSSPFSLRCEKVLTEKTYTRSYPHSDWPKILRSSENALNNIYGIIRRYLLVALVLASFIRKRHSFVRTNEGLPPFFWPWAGWVILELITSPLSYILKRATRWQERFSPEQDARSCSHWRASNEQRAVSLGSALCP